MNECATGKNSQNSDSDYEKNNIGLHENDN